MSYSSLSVVHLLSPGAGISKSLSNSKAGMIFFIDGLGTPTSLTRILNLPSSGPRLFFGDSFYVREPVLIAPIPDYMRLFLPSPIAVAARLCL